MQYTHLSTHARIHTSPQKWIIWHQKRRKRREDVIIQILASRSNSVTCAACLPRNYWGISTTIFVCVTSSYQQQKITRKVPARLYMYRPRRSLKVLTAQLHTHLAERHEDGLRHPTANHTHLVRPQRLVSFLQHTGAHRLTGPGTVKVNSSAQRITAKRLKGQTYCNDRQVPFVGLSLPLR